MRGLCAAPAPPLAAPQRHGKCAAGAQPRVPHAARAAAAYCVASATTRRNVRAAAVPGEAVTAPATLAALAALDGLLAAARAAVDDTASEASAASASEARAVELVRSLRVEGGPLRGFGAATLVPKRDYTLAELRLNKLEPAAFLSPRDTTLEGVRAKAVAAVAAGAAAVVTLLHPSTSQLMAGGLSALTLAMVDQVGNGGAGEALVLDTLGRATSAAYRGRVARHESGHFLVAYLVGLLPRAYTLSAWDALRSEGARNVQAGTQFCDAAFQREVAGGKLSSGSLDAYTCIALAGVASEVLQFETAEGGLNDVQQLDGLLRALSFTQKRSDSQVRWAALATVTLLRRHTKAHDALEAAMLSGASVASCIAVLEQHLDAVV
jgi:hypothetical protein